MRATPPSPAQPADRTALRARLEQLCRNNGSIVLAPQPSGFPELDACVGGGWPTGALTECLLDSHGIGELSLWMPALRKIALEKRYIAFIAPPFLPYAPALVQHGLPLKQVLVIDCDSAEESLWATEQALRCSAFGAVLAWPHANCSADKHLRRLQLAAEAGRNLGILYRPLSTTQVASPAALRIKLQADASGLPNSLQIVIHKCRGGYGGATVRCTLDRYEIDCSPHAA